MRIWRSGHDTAVLVRHGIPLSPMEGGLADFRLMPAFAENGRVLFARGTELWEPLVAQFCEREGFAALR